MIRRQDLSHLGYVDVQLRIQQEPPRKLAPSDISKGSLYDHTVFAFLESE